MRYKDNMGNSKCISFTKKSQKLHKPLLKLAGKVAKLACISGSTISTAESCTGGNERAPVGTVYIAITLSHGTKCYQFKFEGNRQQIRIQTCVEALKILLGELKILVIPCLETV